MRGERRQPDALSIHRSFVIHIYAGCDPERGAVSGRIEHVVSGEAEEFGSVKQLLRCMTRLLSRASVQSERYY